MERRGAAQKYKNNLLLHMGQKSRDDLFKTGCYPSTHPPPPPCSTCLSERSEKLETAQEELTIFSLGDQRHCGLTLKLKIQISMYSEMGTVCVTTRHQAQVCQLELTQTEERVQSSLWFSLGCVYLLVATFIGVILHLNCISTRKD